MMRVQIKETKEIKELGIIDIASGQDWVKDFIGNGGAFNDGQFEYDDELELYQASSDTVEWWEDAIMYNEWQDRVINEIRNCDLLDSKEIEIIELRLHESCGNDYADTTNFDAISEALKSFGRNYTIVDGSDENGHYDGSIEIY